MKCSVSSFPNHLRTRARGAPRRGFAALAVLAAGLCLAAGRAEAGWEIIDSYIGTLGRSEVTVNAGGNTYTLADTFGEPAAWDNPPQASSQITSGYLSQMFIDQNPLALASDGGFVASTATFRDGAVVGALSTDNLGVLFTVDIDTASVANGVFVREITDHMDLPVATTAHFNIASGGQYVMELDIESSSGAWRKGSTYEVRFTTGLVSILGEQIQSEEVRRFTVIRDHAFDNRRVDEGDSSTNVTLPSGALASDFFLSLSSSTGGPGTGVAATPLPGGRTLLKTLAANIYTAQGARFPNDLAKPAVYSFSYQADGKGVLSGAGPVRYSKDLSVWWYNGTQDRWARMPQSGVDPQAQSVTLQTVLVSTYAMVASLNTDVSPVFAYPVPFRPNAGDAARYGRWSDGIRFANAPSEGTIHIYTLSGRLVRSLDVASSMCGSPATDVCWDVKNSGGVVVASGVYIWEIMSGDNRKTGKLAVIK
ncbi:MAG: T9SS type A sorting domain-containing protein [Elusimicrobiales bacterium]